MALLDTPLDTITERDLQRLISAGAAESLYIDYKQVPLPGDVLHELDREFGVCDAQRDPDRANERIWTWSRTTAWRRVKEIMAAAGISGTPAMPNGLRHGFGVNAFQSNVPPHLIQRWLGHASLRTTAIYGDVIGPDERAFAERIGQDDTERVEPV